MMKKSILIICTLFTCFSHAQERTQTVGFELDALPYLSGGWYISGWYGQQHLRYRGVYAQTIVPQFAVPDGFTNHELKVGAFIVDYFFKPNFEGWWVAAGYEYWYNSIQDEAQTDTYIYGNNVTTVGGGYVWKFYKNFYLNPWAAGHILITGTDPVTIGGSVYQPSVFTPEISLKLGWHF
jgi:hypothetical protein